MNTQYHSIFKLNQTLFQNCPSYNHIMNNSHLILYIWSFQGGKIFPKQSQLNWQRLLITGEEIILVFEIQATCRFVLHIINTNELYSFRFTMFFPQPLSENTVNGRNKKLCALYLYPQSVQLFSDWSSVIYRW